MSQASEQDIEDELTDDEETGDEDPALPSSEKPISEGTDDEDKETLQSASLSPEASEKRRLSKRPSIDHLKDGTVDIGDGTLLPLFNVGDRIVAERYISFLRGSPWLDTRVYTVLSIDDDAGVAYCMDEELQHKAAIGFRHKFTTVKLAPAKGNPFSKRARASRKAQPTVDENAGEDKPKKRGRPKGSKNRSREEIERDRREKMSKKKGRRS